MNEFHMSHLAESRTAELHAEAARHRLARTARAAAATPGHATSRVPRRLGLRLLFGRTGA